jgi:chromosomal replication initiation ATPase DnaA
MTCYKRRHKKQTLPHQSHQVDLVIATVCLEFGVTETDIKNPKRQGRHLRFARQVAMYLSHIIYEMNHTLIGERFAKDRSTISHACKVVEESRDDPVFDMKIIKLENFLRQAPQPLSVRMAALNAGLAA